MISIQSLMRSKKMPILIALALAVFRVAAAAPPTSSDEKMIEDLTMPRKRAVPPKGAGGFSQIS
jgi:hypothetical protein